MFLYEEVYSQQQYLQHGVQLKPGDTVLDAGGNIGLFAMLAAEVTVDEPAPPRCMLVHHRNLQQH
jgi:cyclopropane fatty-acyl-phospholipid synthase-like methyltransferase